MKIGAVVQMGTKPCTRSLRRPCHQCIKSSWMVNQQLPATDEDQIRSTESTRSRLVASMFLP
jgi:hypothetical protein